MEDGIETYKTSIFSTSEDLNSNWELKKYIYIYSEKYGSGNIMIIDDIKKAIEFSKKKRNEKIDIFIKDKKGFYTTTNEYFENGIKCKDV